MAKYFTFSKCQCSRTQCFHGVAMTATVSPQSRIWSFHVVVSQRTAKKCTKIYNARAQSLFCSLSLLLCGVLVAVAVAVAVAFWLRS